MTHPLRVLTQGEFPYSLRDVDRVTEPLGIVWELLKDQDFAPAVTFTGFLWNLDTYTVELTSKKREKYLQAIADWKAKPLHTLEETQKLLGKLLHASNVTPGGRAYLTCLEAFLGVCVDKPSMPRRPPRDTNRDLDWWATQLSRTFTAIPIPGPVTILRLHAFSDASSGVGIGVILGNRWRAWRFRPGWKSERREIGWAEAVGFEFLVRLVIQSNPPHPHLRLHGDNQGVVAAWRNGRSRNPQVNSVFKRIHEILVGTGIHIYCDYVPSNDNPADGPSRGQYPPQSNLLPPIDIPLDVAPFLEDVRPGSERS